jgi:hypothetical protein
MTFFTVLGPCETVLNFLYAGYLLILPQTQRVDVLIRRQQGRKKQQEVVGRQKRLEKERY